MESSCEAIVEHVTTQRLPMAVQAREQIDTWGMQAWAETLCTLPNSQAKAVPKLAAILLRCAEGEQGRQWLRAKPEGEGTDANGTPLTNAEILLPCLSKPTQAVIRRAVAQMFGRVSQT